MAAFVARRTRALLAAGLVASAALFLSGPAAAAPTPAAIDCRAVHIPVSLAAGQTADYQVYGELCSPAGTHPDVVQLLLPGGTYNHVYWDFPYDPDRYSYVRHAVPAGYATLDIDRIATGQSSRPNSLLINTDVNAYVAHQVVRALKSPQLGAFDKVIAVGHSYGSITAMVEAATFHDVDGVIDTGILHKLAPTGAAQIPLYLNEPANIDPSGRFTQLPLGFVTTEPGTRKSFFYNASNADPQVVATDEATKDTFTAGELATFPLVLVNGTTSNIHVPVLVVIGGKDIIFCGLGGSDCSSSARVQAQEKPFYPADACLESYVLANSGHDVNLHLNSTDWYAQALSWANRHFAGGRSSC
ncbi:alpha/beta fold hydrolase [Fodinicola feengrottensis]|uniref:Alpha/beta fold hydrolase n=2 Tax=Fodinicola feengrottensis TaxID=435914 RepID=A0ABN2HEV7_9ACTN